ncbi:MAG: SUMF1/EgtB/PvdO family nonheme iron enzyme [Candidatus Eisenbacteria bacterium]
MIDVCRTSWKKQTSYTLGLLVAVGVLLSLSCGDESPDGPADDQPPRACFSVAPLSGSTTTDFQLDASCSSDNQDPVTAIQVRWDWENDGTWDTQWSSTKTATHRYGTTGTKTIHLVTKDTAGLVDDTTHTVTVSSSNTVPTASLTVVPLSGTTETDFQFDASASSDSEDPVETLQVRWDWENDGTWDTPYALTKTATHRFSTTGTKVINLEVKDTGGLVDDTTQTVTVSAVNTAPAALFTVDPLSGTTETDFQFDASGSSDGEDPVEALQVRWDWENDGTWDTPYAVTKTAMHRYSTTGTKVIKQEVKDTGGLVDDTTRTVTVSPGNTSPTASFTVDPLSGTTETDFQFDASGSSDGEDPVEALQVRWDWENDGTWDTPYAITKTATHRYVTTGTKVIKLEVKDTGGLVGDTTRSITVQQPVPMVLIPAGPFTMGSDPGEGYSDEEPEHTPYTSAFYIDAYEVTNAEYAEALNWAIANGRAYWNGSEVVRSSNDGTLYLNVSRFYSRIDRSGSVFVVESNYDDHPVVEVSWYGSAAYCNWRSEREERTPCYNTSTWECDFGANGYRLPTEAEWEKGARGSSGERTYPWGEEAPDCSRVNAWLISGACVDGTKPVGSYPTGRSPYGLYDMAGNVWEWCNDWYASGYYSDPPPPTDPRGPSTGSDRVLRGGSWSYYILAYGLRCAYRVYGEPLGSFYDIGFRSVRRP